ncbi:MAG: hypothetical protein ACXWLG_05105 [Myxococcaceae bacterium]
MSGARPRGAVGLSRAADRALEGLVLAVSVLDAGRAAMLLRCLADPLRPAALGLLARLEGMGRAGRHAALVRVFGQTGVGTLGAASIPGALGAEVRRQLGPGGDPMGASGPRAMERWARRLALELGVLNGEVGRGVATVLPRRSAIQS